MDVTSPPVFVKSLHNPQLRIIQFVYSTHSTLNVKPRPTTKFNNGLLNVNTIQYLNVAQRAVRVMSCTRATMRSVANYL